MRKLIFFLMFVMGLSIVSFAQMSAKMKMQNGVMMVGKKAMLCEEGKCSPLTRTYNCADHCKVLPDGTVTKPDGTTKKLENGFQIAKSGKITMIPHGQTGHVCGPDAP